LFDDLICHGDKFWFFFIFFSCLFSINKVQLASTVVVDYKIPSQTTLSVLRYRTVSLVSTGHSTLSRTASDLYDCLLVFDSSFHNSKNQHRPIHHHHLSFPPIRSTKFLDLIYQRPWFPRLLQSNSGTFHFSDFLNLLPFYVQSLN
jgi:hypothetical protein